MFGDQKLGPDLPLLRWGSAGTHPSWCEMGAQMLGPLDAEALFAEDGDRC